MSNSFSWKTKFKSIIIVDGELFSNEYDVKISLTPHTASLKEQTAYFDRLKSLFEQVFANTITTWREEPLYEVLKKNTNNRFIELPRPPYDQIMAAVCFCKANSILDSKIPSFKRFDLISLCKSIIHLFSLVLIFEKRLNFFATSLSTS